MKLHYFNYEIESNKNFGTYQIGIFLDYGLGERGNRLMNTLLKERINNHQFEYEILNVVKNNLPMNGHPWTPREIIVGSDRVLAIKINDNSINKETMLTLNDAERISEAVIKHLKQEHLKPIHSFMLNMKAYEQFKELEARR